MVEIGWILGIHHSLELVVEEPLSSQRNIGEVRCLVEVVGQLSFKGCD